MAFDFGLTILDFGLTSP